MSTRGDGCGFLKRGGVGTDRISLVCETPEYEKERRVQNKPARAEESFLKSTRKRCLTPYVFSKCASKTGDKHCASTSPHLRDFFEKLLLSVAIRPPQSANAIIQRPLKTTKRAQSALQRASLRDLQPRDHLDRTDATSHARCTRAAHPGPTLRAQQLLPALYQR